MNQFDPIKQLRAAERRAARPPEQRKRARITEAFFGRFAGLPLRERQARSLAYALLHTPVRTGGGPYLAGQLYTEYCGDLGGSDFDPRWRDFDCNYVAEQRARREIPGLAELTGADRDGKNPSWVTYASCAPGHVGWRYEWILESGVTGLLRRIRRSYRKADAEGREFLEGCRILLEAMLAWNDLHAKKLEKALRSCRTEVRRRELRAKLALVRRVPRYGARTFHEALQAFHFSYLATMFENPYGGNGPGRLDYFLWPYLERDLAAGRETVESATEKVAELFLRMHERNYCKDMGIETIMVAGSRPDGSSAFNPLSEIMVRVIMKLAVTTPHVYIRIPENPPPALLELAAEYLKDGHNMAQILSDRSIVPALVRGGVAPEDAAMYMCGGCMELSPQGMNCDLLFTGFFNVPKILELTLNGGICLNTGCRMLSGYRRTLEEFDSFEELYGAFLGNLKTTLGFTFRCMDLFSEEAARLRPAFLLSAQVSDCIERARNLNDGGARYNDYGSTPIGLPDAADSLYALKHAVFENGIAGKAGLLAALQSNFASDELLRLRLLELPKFGQGDPEADGMAARLFRDVCAIYDGFSNRFGGKVKPMLMSFVFSPIAGNALGASANGHKAGVPVAQGMTPHSSSMTRGIGTAMQSANRLDLGAAPGGVASMWDLSGGLTRLDVLQGLLRSFIATGGQIFQGNTTSVKELRAARRDPESYRHLIVRVGGFSAKFTALDPQLQDEIINRHRHCV